MVGYIDIVGIALCIEFIYLDGENISLWVDVAYLTALDFTLSRTLFSLSLLGTI